MSQTETTLIQQTSMEEPKVVVSSFQVAPQLEEEGEREKAEKGSKINPEYVKSPITEPVATTNRANSTKSKSSLKPFQKGGFLSLLLCCTAGSFLDNSDKSSSSLVKKNNNNAATTSRTSQQTATTTATTEVPPIITNQTELENLSSSNNTHNKIPTPTTTDNINKETETTAILSTSPTTQLSPGPEVWLLPPLATEDKEKKCLVLDLDETLVHSSFKMIPNPDFIVPVEIDNQYHNVYVLKRPGVDEFMRKMGEIYEIVVFTASLAKYADPVLDMLDIHRVVKHRLFRESCFNHKGTYVKDLSQLGRDLTSTLILDNSPASYIFHTSNAVPVSTWFNDPHDTELTDLIAFLEDLTMVDDVQLILNTAIDTVIPST